MLCSEIKIVYGMKWNALRNNKQELGSRAFEELYLVVVVAAVSRGMKVV